MGLGPELVDPEIDVHEAVRPDSVDSAGAFALDRDKAAVEQSLQVLGHGRPADRQSICKFIHRLRLPPQLLQEVPPVRIGNSLENILGHGLKLRQTPSPGKSGMHRLGSTLVVQKPSFPMHVTPKTGLIGMMGIISSCPEPGLRRATGISGSFRSRSWELP